MAREARREFDLRVLPGREAERSARLDREAQAPDVVGQLIDREHATAHDARRMHHEILGVDAAHRGVVPYLRAAREDDAASALLRRQGVLRMLEFVHVAAEQLAFAGAAVAGLAGERERHAGAQQRLEDRVPGLDGNRLSMALEGDLHALSRRARMLARRLLKSQIVWTPNKIAGSTGGCSLPACC